MSSCNKQASGSDPDGGPDGIPALLNPEDANGCFCDQLIPAGAGQVSKG